MGISASSCDGPDRSGLCWNELGAQFTVATMDGAYLGSCTLTGIPSGILASCSVLVPKGITVVVTEDVSTITPGYVPEENPIYFDTGTTTQASHWGPIFYHGP